MVPYALLLTAALMTAFYMLRAYSMTFMGKPRSDAADHAHESSPLMLIPLGVLSIGSLFMGWIQTPHFMGGGHLMETAVKSSWGGAEAMKPFAEHKISVGGEILMILAVVALILGVAYYSFKVYREFQSKKFISPAERAVGPTTAAPFINASQNKFFVDEAYDLIFVRPLRFVSGAFFRIVDETGINGLLHGMRKSLDFSSGILSWAHTGNVQTYAWYLAAGAAILLIFVGRVLL